MIAPTDPKEYREILDEYQITRRTSSVPYQHSSNGFIERTVQTIMGIARTIMLIYDTPLSFWNYAIKHSVRLYNIRPLTPYEMLMERNQMFLH